jgi:hypothetical protein
LCRSHRTAGTDNTGMRFPTPVGRLARSRWRTPASDNAGLQSIDTPIFIGPKWWCGHRRTIFSTTFSLGDRGVQPQSGLSTRNAAYRPRECDSSSESLCVSATLTAWRRNWLKERLVRTSIGHPPLVRGRESSWGTTYMQNAVVYRNPPYSIPSYSRLEPHVLSGVGRLRRTAGR